MNYPCKGRDKTHFMKIMQDYKSHKSLYSQVVRIVKFVHHGIVFVVQIDLTLAISDLSRNTLKVQSVLDRHVQGLLLVKN